MSGPTSAQGLSAPALSGGSLSGGAVRRADALAREAGLSKFESQEKWISAGPKGVTVFGRNFSWNTVGSFAMQGALLYLLFRTIRTGGRPFPPAGEPREPAARQ
jgi:hypothetical protein